MPSSNFMRLNHSSCCTSGILWNCQGKESSLSRPSPFGPVNPMGPLCPLGRKDGNERECWVWEGLGRARAILRGSPWRPRMPWNTTAQEVNVSLPARGVRMGWDRMEGGGVAWHRVGRLTLGHCTVQGFDFGTGWQKKTSLCKPRDGTHPGYMGLLPLTPPEVLWPLPWWKWCCTGHWWALPPALPGCCHGRWTTCSHWWPCPASAPSLPTATPGALSWEHPQHPTQVPARPDEPNSSSPPALTSLAAVMASSPEECQPEPALLAP